MVWLWLVDIVVVFAVLPVAVRVLQGVLAELEEIRATAEGIRSAAPALIADLDGLGEIVRTQELVHTTGLGLGRYAAALRDILS